MAFVAKKIREISVNPWLMNYLCAYKASFCAFLDFKLKELSQAPQIPPVSIATLKAIILFLTEPEQFLVTLFIGNGTNNRKS